MNTVSINDIIIGDESLTLIAGPCVIESLDHAQRMAFDINEIANKAGIKFIYKSSFDKANRSSITSFRGLGIDKGLGILQKVKDELSRSMDERSAMAIKLQDLMVKISSLPEIYQRVLFKSGDGEGVGDFYDQVADEDGASMFSSWFS